jgi:hypothetical protein
MTDKIERSATAVPAGTAVPRPPLPLFSCCFTAVPPLLFHNSKTPLIPLDIKQELGRIFQHNSGEIFLRA